MFMYVALVLCNFVNTFFRLFISRWLVEVNASPSLTASNATDYDMKFALLTDLINVLDLEGR